MSIQSSPQFISIARTWWTIGELSSADVISSVVFDGLIERFRFSTWIFVKVRVFTKREWKTESGTDKVKRRMIKRISEYARPKIWCPQEDYHLPWDGISMSITSAFPSSTNEKSKIYHNTGIKREDERIFVLQPSMAIPTDVMCHRYVN